MAKTGVVYLCRFAEGEEPVRRFLDSYRRHAAGVEHDLHVVLKGFPDREASDRLRRSFGAQINPIELRDAGYDIGSYLAAAKAVDNPQLLFLNTFSEILADNWLANFDKALALPGVGLVGATGSWQSGSSGYEAAVFRALRRLKGPRRPFRNAKKSVVLADRSDTEAEIRAPINFRRVLRNVPRMGLYPLRIYQFGRHPNPHIRTNAFFIERELFLDLRAPAFRKKMDAYKFESGRNSMTKQIISRGLRPVVVDRLGKIYEASEWKASSTFWIDIQGNLLIADNQTKNYSAGSLERRKVLMNHAWDNPRAWDVAR